MIIDPYKIGEEDLPLVVLSEDRRGFLGWAIKAHSKGNYNHCMEMHRPGYFVSQEITGYKRVLINKYMKSYIRLKFWKKKSITPEQKIRWFGCVEADLDAPWVRRRYDFLGILGHILHIPWVNNPWTKYCYERVAENLRRIFNMHLPNQSTPSKMNEILEKDEDWFVYGYWYAD